LKKSEIIEQPVKIILGNLKKSLKVSRIFNSNSKIIIGSRQPAKKSKNIEYLKYEKKNFLEEFLKDLLDRNISSILVEGGQKTLNAFIVNNLFDELVLYTAPMFLGKESKDAVSINAPDSIKTSMKLKMVSQERFKDDIKITYYNINI
jgi:diaminohydroxyphosphoribosylaminopyrimidine deaminase/5-amino-6-(5-phosphoribosylamino)uracil reductase